MIMSSIIGTAGNGFSALIKHVEFLKNHIFVFAYCNIVTEEQYGKRKNHEF